MAGVNNPVKYVAVTPTDGAGGNFNACDGLWIGVGGTISFVCADPALQSTAAGVSISTTVPAGFFPGKFIRVNATGTAATQILAMY